MRPPRVTLGVTTYNVARYLPQALDSLLAQDYTDFEIVVCDNASTDATWDIVGDYAKRDDRIRAFRNETNVGFAANYRRAVENARGEFFRFTSHDDLQEPTMLSACVAALDEAGPKAVLAFADSRLIDGSGADLGPWPDDLALESRLSWLRVSRFAAHSHLCNENFGVIRMDALRRTHLHPAETVSPDFAMLTELAALGQFVKVPGYLFARRMHAEGTHQGDRTLDEVATLLEPTVDTKAKLAAFANMRLIPRQLMELNLPLSTRLSCTAAFVVRYGSKRLAARVRRHLPPGPPPPWESGVPIPYPAGQGNR